MPSNSDELPPPLDPVEDVRATAVDFARLRVDLGAALRVVALLPVAFFAIV
ncbi:MAG: hypothetical protein V4513_01635 [Pseudomonadota bacterium]